MRKELSMSPEYRELIRDAWALRCEFAKRIAQTQQLLLRYQRSLDMLDETFAGEMTIVEDDDTLEE
jgi:hypothetical protein